MYMQKKDHLKINIIDVRPGSEGYHDQLTYQELLALPHPLECDKELQDLINNLFK